jgi:hypothetical protein
VATRVTDAGAYTAESTAIAYDASGNLLIAEWEPERVSCRVLARTPTEAASLLDSLHRVLPESAASADDAVRVMFWSFNDQRVERVARRLDAPTWSAVHANYSTRTRAHLEALMERSPDLASGKLILWHGPPGTGKTWALRALLREWKDWAEPSYILDPEKFFGQSAGYMMSVILDHDDDAGEASTEKKWRLIVIEDAAELLGKDARLEVGQGLARLLNVCDGLVGQGLRIMILLTTNEDVGAMHPAIIRRGRCIANIQFDLLSAGESREWAVAHGVAPDGARPALRADLFDADQIATPRSRTTAGFRPRAAD